MLIAIAGVVGGGPPPHPVVVVVSVLLGPIAAWFWAPRLTVPLAELFTVMQTPAGIVAVIVMLAELFAPPAAARVKSPHVTTFPTPIEQIGAPGGAPFTCAVTPVSWSFRSSTIWVFGATPAPVLLIVTV